MSYSYLDGSQTGAILQGANNIGQANTAYVPGTGMAPYAAAPPSSGPPNSPMTAAGTPDFGAMSVQQINEWDLWNRRRTSQQGGPLSTYPGGMTSGGTSSSGGTGGGVTVAGQDGWMSPEQLRAQTDALTTSGSSSSGGGGGGGGSATGSTGGGAAAPTSGGGLNLASLAGGSPAPSSAPGNFSPLSVPQGGLTYYAPGQNPSEQNMAQLNPQGGQLQMQQANPQAAMNAYQNTPGYQMLGNDQTAQYQQSPGYQYAVNEALKQVQGQSSARGLLESGSALRAMTDRAQGMAQQDYGNWWNRQNQLYGDYQNRLQGLAGGSTGSQEAMQLGQTMGAGTMQTGSNIGSLFGNQGTAGMGGIINTGAAQSSNITNAGAQQAQVNAANQSTQLAGATLSQNRGLF